MIQIKNYINGKYLDPIQNEWLDNYNPADGSIYGKTPNSSSQDDDAEIARLQSYTK